MTSSSPTAQVSICIPTYNGAPFLEECIASALAQTHADLEVLVVDDCSSDDTLRIAQRMATADPRIRVVRNNANQGLVGNWNRCIGLATGAWIKFLFQDDLLHPDCVQRLLDAARARQARFVACDREFLFDGSIGDQWKSFYARSRASVRGFLAEQGGTTPERYARQILQSTNHNFVGEPTTTLLHASLFVEHGLFDARLAQMCDIEYWNRVASHEGLAFVDATLASFRVHAGATSTTNRSSKGFVSGGLDALTLVDLMLEQPAYARLRQIWQQQGLLEKAQQERQSRSHQVYGFVRQHRRDPDAGAEIAAHYAAFLQKHPQCAVSSAAQARWACHQQMARLVGWVRRQAV